MVNRSAKKAQILAVGLNLGGAVLFLSGCSNAESSTAKRNLPKPILESVSLSDLAAGSAVIQHPPIATFSAQCAQCHGPNGEQYKQPAINQGPAYTEVFRQMMETAPLDPPSNEVDLGAMAAYVASLKANKPFLVVLKAQQTEGGELTLQVEKTQGLQLQVVQGNEPISAEQTQITLTRETVIVKSVNQDVELKLVGRKTAESPEGNEEVILNLSEAIWSK